MFKAQPRRPRFIFIELTNHCNFSCTFCPDAGMKRKRCFMERETARRLIREAGKKRLSAEPLQFHLMGEPLLARDLFEHIEYAHSFGLKVRLLTNGALLNEKTAGRLFALGLDELVIGIQTFGAESFAANRRGKLGYQAYLEGIRSALAAKFAVQAATRIYIHYLNTKEFNRARAVQGYGPVFSPELVDSDEQALAVVNEWRDFGRRLAEKMGLDFSPRDLECLSGEFAGRPLDCMFGDHAEILPGVILGFKGISPFADWMMKDVRTVERFRGRCPAPLEQLAVLADGRATLCCVDYEGEFAIGNAGARGLRALWNSAKAARARRTMARGLLPFPLCRVCKAFVVGDDYALGFGQGDGPVSLVNGFYSLEQEDGRPFRWMGKIARLRVGESLAELELEFRNAAAGGKAMSLELRQGSRRRRYRLPAGCWTVVAFVIGDRAVHGPVVEIEAGRFFIPAEREPGNGDTRELSVMVRGRGAAFQSAQGVSGSALQELADDPGQLGCP